MSAPSPAPIPAIPRPSDGSPREIRTVRIFDTTLRDGEQCPGATLYPAEKVRIARQLEKLGVDVIEAGFPASSQDDAEAVRLVGAAVRCPVAALARCVPADIQSAADAMAAMPPAQRLLHGVLRTSPFQRDRKLHLSPPEILDLIRTSVAHARRLCPNVLFSAEDAFRTETPFLVRALQTALDAGATELNIPDTVGIALPEDVRAFVAYLRSQIPALAAGTHLHIHCHNDLGLATANSLAAVEAGATTVHCTINGIGERAGNCPLEELAVAIRTRPDAAPLATHVRATELYATSRLVSNLTAISPQPHKPVVGANAFAHESGIHQDGLLKDPRTYEIIPPASVGRSPRAELVLGRHSGRAGFVDHIVRLGINLPPDKLQALYAAFQALADKKRIVYDDDLLVLLKDHFSDIPPVYLLHSLSVSAGTSTTPSATVELERDGIRQSATTGGTGPVDAAFHAIDKISGIPGELKSFAINAVTRGQDALGEATLSVLFNGRSFAAKASDIDIITAAVKAYLNALNRFLAPR